MAANELMTADEREALEALLAAHCPHDDKERRDRDLIAAFVGRHADAHLRSNAAGHLTGSAFVLETTADGRPRPRVLLTHHARLGRWLQVGGHGEGERDPAAIAMREAVEESGLAGLRLHAVCAPHEGGKAAGLARPFDLDVHEIPATAKERAHLHLDLRYVVLAPPGQTPQMNAAESKDLRFFALDEALALPGLDASLRRALGRLALLEDLAAG